MSKVLEDKKNISWHTENIENTVKKLNTTKNGLKKEEAKKRFEKSGPNELKGKKSVSPLILLLEQFKDFLILVLIIAAVISGVKGEWIETIAIMVIVILSGVMGFIQEYQAGKAIEALKKMAAPNTTVIRNGEEMVIPAREMVPGDLFLIKTGDKISADGRIIELMNLKVNEAPLTGESLPVEKNIKSLDKADIPLGDRKNIVYTGTSVTYGRGKAIVTATGMNTEFGKIATMLDETETRKTPLQKNLDQLGKYLGIFSLVLAFLIAALGAIKGFEIQEMFIWGVALAVAVIPEALPAVVTVSLALGVRRLVKRRALIRSLPAVETLGATTVICSDKTGTLTQDEMTVRKIYVNGKIIDVSGSGYNPEGKFTLEGNAIDVTDEKSFELFLKAGLLCNDTVLKLNEGKWEIIGDPTEGALVVLSEKAGFKSEVIRKSSPRIDEIPFSSEKKRMTTVHKIDKNKYAYSKGAPEVIIDSCSKIYKDNEFLPFKEEEKEKILEAAQSMGENALRVLALSFKEITEDRPSSEIEEDMVFAGLAGMIDPPRKEAKAAIATCKKAGIRPVMITGDHKVTAIAVAKELGLIKEKKALTGVEVEKFSEEELDRAVEETQVFARISPEHKLRIVESFIKKGEVVAMTGDGVNDAPALKKADIGVAMGITGTDVSKEASDMILTDDNFASIVAAVEEGRSIFENIKKYLAFLLSGNMGTVIAMILCLIIYKDFPLSAVQILFINLIMDGLIAIALGVEPPEKGIMERPPRKLKEGILNKRVLQYIGAVGIWIALITTGVYGWAKGLNLEVNHPETMFFTTLIMARLFNGFNCRSLNSSLLTTGIRGNKWLIVSGVSAMALTLAVLYLHVFHVPFETLPLTLNEWIIVTLSAVTVILFVEIEKLILRAYKK